MQPLSPPAFSLPPLLAAKARKKPILIVPKKRVLLIKITDRLAGALAATVI